MSLNIVILAAGQGRRMHSELPKVLHKLGGVTLLERVVNTAQQFKADIYVVFGNGGEEVPNQLQHLQVHWVEQKERLGTGHAVLQALPLIQDDSQVLVLVGDIPLVSAKTLERLIKKTQPNGVGLVTTEVDDPTGFGRILHDQTGKVLGIVEHRDATTKQRKIKEINSGIMVAPASKLKEWLPKLKNNNAQAEYYLTDIIAQAVAENYDVQAVLAQPNHEVLGINDRIQLADLERHYQMQMARQFMENGVTIADPNRFDLRGSADIAHDVFIDVNVILEGQVRIGKNSTIGPNCYLKNVIIAESVNILANTVIEDAIIDEHCCIGPFTRIRPGTQLKQNAKVGNFVEMKKTIFGERSKAAHLSYLGDAEIGKDVNVGCGTITCNYDGANKHKTIIEDDVHIGSDVQLVAPVKVGSGATIAAGSTITQNAPANQLTVSRHKEQVSIPHWQRPKKEKSKGE